MTFWRLFSLGLVLSVALLGCTDSDADPTATPDSGPSIRVTVSEALAFSAPSREAEVVFRLIEGDQAPITARTESDALGVPWYQVARGEVFGWVAGSQVTLQGDASALRVAPLEVPTLPVTLAPADLAIVTATPLRVSVTDPIAVANTPDTPIYDLPRRDATILETIEQGDTLDIVGRNAADSLDARFYFVGRGGAVVGWVAAADVSTQGNLNRVETIQDADLSISAFVPTEAALALTAQATQTEGAAGLIPDIAGTVAAPEAQPDTPASPTRTPSDTTPPSVNVTPIDATPIVATPIVATPIVVTPDPDQPTPTRTTVPLVSADATSLLSPVPSVTVPPTATVDLVGTAGAAPSATPFSSPTPLVSPTPTEVPQISEGVPPPLTLALPDGWRAANVRVPIQSAFFQGNLPISVYEGPILGDAGRGTLWIIWAFPNVTGPQGEVNLFGDGVQLLRGVLLDTESCTVGLDQQRTVMIGNREAVGTIFSAVGCEDSADFAGQFGILQVDGGNFAFYVGVEPPRLANEGLIELQAILDSVNFLSLDDLDDLEEGNTP